MLEIKKVNGKNVNFSGKKDSEVVEKETFKLDSTYKKITRLPSNFLSYPKGVEIYFKPLTTGEIEKLNESELSARLKIESDLNSIYVVGMDKYSLTKDDYAYIALMRKLYSQDEILGVYSYTCSACGVKQSFDFNLAEVEFNQPEVKSVPGILKIGDYWVSIGFLTVKDLISIYERKEAGENLTATDFTAYMVQGIGIGESLDSLTWEDSNYDRKKEILASAWGEERECLSELDDMLYHGLRPVEAICSDCGNKMEVDLGDIFALIFPKRRSREYLRNKISFM